MNYDRARKAGSTVIYHEIHDHALDNTWPYKPDDPYDSPLGDGWLLTVGLPGTSPTVPKVTDFPSSTYLQIDANIIEISDDYQMGACYFPPDNNVGIFLVMLDYHKFHWEVDIVHSYGPPVISNSNVLS